MRTTLRRSWMLFGATWMSLATLTACGTSSARPDAMPDVEPMGPSARILTEAGGVAMCPPGSVYRFTCSPACNDGARSCANDPILRVCDAARDESACEAGLRSAVLGEGSANCGGPCQGVVVSCPASGVVRLAGYNASGGVFLCEARGRMVPRESQR